MIDFQKTYIAKYLKMQKKRKRLIAMVHSVQIEKYFNLMNYGIRC